MKVKETEERQEGGVLDAGDCCQQRKRKSLGRSSLARQCSVFLR